MAKVITRFQLTGDAATVEELVKFIPAEDREKVLFSNHIIYEEAEKDSDRHKELCSPAKGGTILFYGQKLCIEGISNASPCIPGNQQLNTLYDFCVFQVSLT